MLVDPPGERAFIQRGSRNHADVTLHRYRKQVLLGRLIENIVDHLRGIDQAALDDLQGAVRLVVIDGNPDGLRFPGALEVFERALPLVAGDPFRVPHVQLLHVDCLKPKILQAALGRFHDVFVGKNFGNRNPRPRRPQHVLWRHLRGDINLVLGLAHHLADKLLAVAVAIRQCGVNEVHTPLDGHAQGLGRLPVVAPQPQGSADAPRAVTHLAHLKSGFSQPAVAHHQLL